MKHLITIFFILTSLAIAVDNRLVTISVKDSLAEGWKDKVDDAVCEIMGQTNVTKKCYWIGYTNASGEKWQACTYWNDYQFGQKPLTNIEAILDIKIPKPFRDDVLAFAGNPQDAGLYPTNSVTP
jgi:hypothetical protein